MKQIEQARVDVVDFAGAKVTQEVIDGGERVLQVRPPLKYSTVSRSPVWVCEKLSARLATDANSSRGAPTTGTADASAATK